MTVRPRGVGRRAVPAAQDDAVPYGSGTSVPPGGTTGPAGDIRLDEEELTAFVTLTAEEMGELVPETAPRARPGSFRPHSSRS